MAKVIKFPGNKKGPVIEALDEPDVYLDDYLQYSRPVVYLPAQNLAGYFLWTIAIICSCIGFVVGLTS